MKILEILLKDPHADVNWKNVDGDSALHYALELRNLKAIELLCQCPRTFINAQDYWLNTPLHKAAIIDFKEAVEVILQSPNVDLFITNASGEIPYQSARAYSSTEIIDMIEDMMPPDAIDEPLSALHS